MGQNSQPYAIQQENFQKKNCFCGLWKITNFGRQAALFNDASMEAIT